MRLTRWNPGQAVLAAAVLSEITTRNDTSFRKVILGATPGHPHRQGARLARIDPGPAQASMVTRPRAGEMKALSGPGAGAGAKAKAAEVQDRGARASRTGWEGERLGLGQARDETAGGLRPGAV